MFEPDIDHEACLPWKTICRLAVMAMISGVSLNDIAVRAIERYLANRRQKGGLCCYE